MQDRLKAVVIGAAHVHILEVSEYCNTSDDFILTAIADTTPILESDALPQKRYCRSWNKEYVKKYGAKYYDDYIEMLEQEKPDLAFITTENGRHLEVYTQCAKRGIAVSVEKPMACNLHDALTMARLSRLYHAPLMVNWPIAWRPWLNQMKAVVDSGRIGDVIKVRHMAGLTGPVGPGAVHRGTGGLTTEPMTDMEKSGMWWYNTECGGGALLDMCCYGSMVSDWIIGKPAQGVQAMKSNFCSQFGNAEDNACMLVRFPGSIAVIEGTWTTPALAIAPGPEIYGTEGVIRCERRGTLGAVKIMDKFGNEETLEVLEQFESWKNMPTAYASFVKNQSPMPEMTKLENNLRVIAMLDAARRSALSGQYETCNNSVWESGHGV